MIKPRVISYAQNREDLILQGFFDEDEAGFYVDIGAEAPTNLSVTKIFYDKGWNGINIEPIKELHELFLIERPRDINLNIGIADKAGIVAFRQYEGTGYSTFSPEMMEEHKNDDERYVKRFKDYEVEVKMLSSVLTEYGNPKINFMKIDVEGLEYEVLAGNDWQKYRPEVICIEANHIKKDWRSLLTGQGYTKVFFDGLNEYYTDNTTDRAKKFSYVKAIIYKEPIVNFRLLEDFAEYDKVVAWLEGDKKELEKKIEKANRDIENLHRLLEEISSLRGHIKKSTIQKLISLDRRLLAKLQKSRPYTPALYNEASEKPSIETAKNIDQENFLSFSQPKKVSPLYPFYARSRSSAVRAAKKARRIHQKLRNKIG